MIDEPLKRTEAYLRNAAENAAPGTRLPSVRDCMLANKVSKVVVDRAAAKLHGERLIDIRPRSGLYRADNKDEKRRQIAILHYGSREHIYSEDSVSMNFHGELLLAVNAAISGMKWRMSMYTMECENNMDELIAELLKSETETVVTISIPHAKMDHLRILKEAGISVYNLLPDVVELLPATIRLDDFEIVRKQLDYLLAAGHRRIAYLHSCLAGTYNRAQNSRLNAFCRLALENKLETAPEWVCESKWNDAEVERNLLEMFDKSGVPSAIIINDNHAGGTYSAIRKRGLEPGKDIAVIGCDDMPWSRYLNPSLSTVRVSRKELAELLCSQIRDENQNSLSAPTMLIERASSLNNIK